MSYSERRTEIKMIPIEKINILNPRVRSKKVFEGVVDNIARVGLKKPITVIPCKSGAAGKDYDLVCGQGRLEAFIACGETQIPAVIIDASEEEALVMSLVENLARRQPRALDLLQAIEILKKQGYNTKAIAEKTGLTDSYVSGILRLMRQGEERLLAAVEKGSIPLAVAMIIADAPDAQLQQVLQEAYETKQLRGKRLLDAKRLLEKRKYSGKGFGKTGSKNSSGHGQVRVSVQDVMKVLKKEVDVKRHMTRKAEKTSNHLTFVIGALQTLFKEEHFNTLLKAEKINSLPKQISDLLAAKGHAHG
jgi:ParB family chromosome partitioning protein